MYDGELYFPQQIILQQFSCEIIVICGDGVRDGVLIFVIRWADIIVFTLIVEIADEEIMDVQHGDELIESQSAGYHSTMACDSIQMDFGGNPDVCISLRGKRSGVIYLLAGEVIMIVVRKVAVFVHVKRAVIDILLITVTS